MPRSRGGAAPARSAPTRPQAAPPARGPAPQQQRPMSTAPAQAQHAPPQAQSQSPGLFGQMASTAAGVAVGSSIGHAIGGFFGGGSTQAAQPEYAQQPAAAQDNLNYAQAGAYNTNATAGQEASGPCATDIKNFTSCMNQNNGDLNICGWYMEQLKACQQAAKNY